MFPVHPSPTIHETGKLYQMTYPARDVRVRPSTGLSAYSTMLRLYVNDASERILPSPSCLSICSSTSFSIYPLTCFLERWPEKSSTKSLVRRYENACLIQSRKSQSPQTSNSEIWELELSLFQQKLSVKARKSRNNTVLSNRGDWLRLRLREAE